MSSYTIVAFCGGGIRGLLSATVLNRLATKHPEILTSTSLFAGTSTGADIINMLLAGWGTQKIVDYYQTSAVKFFQNPKTDPSAPAYSVDEAYAGAVSTAKGNPLLSAFLPQQVVMTSFDVGQDHVPWQPVLFGNIPRAPVVDWNVADAATASSAMPGMLGSWKGKIDGAFLNHDPTLPAVCAAVASGIALEDIYAITIGTGLMSDWIASDTKTWGAKQWQDGDLNPFNKTPALYINGKVSPIDNASLNGMTTNTTPMLVKMLLGHRYTNINPAIPFIAENDVSQPALNTLVSAGNNAAIADAEALLELAWNHLAPRPSPEPLVGLKHR
ncbi:MAG TPA: patatin-like phospholipase family protein [Kofleriaceae bacterium]|jgi:patatin-like phospholipase/acyl hydrolase